MPSPSEPPPLRVTLACVGAALLALAGVGHAYQRARADSLAHPDELHVEAVRQRLAAVPKPIAPNTILGLVTDMNWGRDETPIMLIHYVLAPRQITVLGRTSGPEWAIGVFQKQVDPVAAGKATNYAVEETLPGGLIIYHRNTR